MTSPDPQKITAEWLRTANQRGEKVGALTAYDYPTARLLDEAGVPVLLVGDSLGMVVLGYPDTTEVTLDDMLHHVAAVARAKTRALVVADLPIHTYDTPSQALANARRLRDAGAEAVKLEGGTSVLPQVAAIISDGIPLVGHLGMLPQRVRVEGGYKIKGKTQDEREKLIGDAVALSKAGVCAIVLELVVPEVANEMTTAIPVPTIGIGSGPGCSGQILVTPDLIGSFPWFTPGFVKPRADAASTIRQAARDFLSGL